MANSLAVKIFTKDYKDKDVDFTYKINRFIRDLESEPEKIDFMLQGRDRILTCVITYWEGR